MPQVTNRTLTIPTHDGSLFTWHDKLGVIDASDLGRRVSARVWADSCDDGFRIRSPRTGAEQLFVFSHVEKDKEGDVCFWEYVSHPNPGIVVRVFNT
jgi:hypothetical protein